VQRETGLRSPPKVVHAVAFLQDCTRPENEQFEVGLYSVADGKVVREKFFYPTT
jgi:hypothetical protein